LALAVMLKVHQLAHMKVRTYGLSPTAESLPQQVSPRRGSHTQPHSRKLLPINWVYLLVMYYLQKVTLRHSTGELAPSLAGQPPSPVPPCTSQQSKYGQRLNKWPLTFLKQPPRTSNLPVVEYSLKMPHTVFSLLASLLSLRTHYGTRTEKTRVN